MEKEIQEFSFKMSTLRKAFKKGFLKKIPTSLLKRLDGDEQTSLLLGLLNSEVRNSS